MKRPPKAYELVKLQKSWHGWRKGHPCKVTSRNDVAIDAKHSIKVVRVHFFGRVSYSAYFHEDLFKQLFERDRERYGDLKSAEYEKREAAVTRAFERTRHISRSR